MTYTGPVFRPPFEANSLLLEVTVGCSHNACTFCTMYRGTPFSVSPMEQIERDLWEARRAYSDVRRVFLVNADPFALSAERLAEIDRPQDQQNPARGGNDRHVCFGQKHDRQDR